MDEFQQRNDEIARTLGKSVKAEALAARYGLSKSHVYRIAKAGRVQVESFQASGNGNGRSNVGGNRFAEIGTTGLRRFGGDIDEDYDRVFRPLNKKLALFKEMADDPIVAAVLQAIRMTLRRVSWYVDPAGVSSADQKASEWLDSCMNDMSQSWSDTIDQILNMMRDGFQPFEVVYKKRAGLRNEASSKYSDGKIGWRKWLMLGTDSLAPGTPWSFDDHGGLQGINQTAPPDYKLTHIPIDKSILFRTSTDKANPEGRSILRAMYPAWYMKKNLEEIEAISAERIGAGFPVAYLGSDVGKNLSNPNSDASLIQDALRNIRVDEQMGLLVPFAKMGGGAREGEGVLFEFASPPGSKALDFNLVITRYEQRMTMVGLAQFIHLGMNQVGARALGESSQDFFTTAVSGWADSMEDTINRYGAERLFRLNSFPGIEQYPRIRHDTVGRYSLAELSDYISKLAGVGALVVEPELEKYIRAFADLPERPIQIKSMSPSEPVPGKPVAPKEAIGDEKGAANGPSNMNQEMDDGTEKAAENLFNPHSRERFFNPEHDAKGRFAPGGGGESGEGSSSVGGESITKEQQLEFDASDLTPARAPKFHGGDMNDALTAAARTSLYHGEPAHVYATHSGFKVSMQRPSLPGGNTFTRVSATRGGNKIVVKLQRIETHSDSSLFDRFVDLRGAGHPGAKSKPVQAVNAYQTELSHIYSRWSDDLAAQLAEAEPGERDDILEAALVALLISLRAEGRKRITDGLMLALDGEPPTPEMLQELTDAISENDSYLADSLVPAIRSKIEAGLVDEDVLAALGIGEGAVAIGGILDTLGGRVAMYVGGWWALFNTIAGLGAKEHGKPVRWARDFLAHHCDTCLEFGDRDYESYEALLAETGGITPANGTDCQGNCRCSLYELD